MACLADQWEDPERDDDSFRAVVALQQTGFRVVCPDELAAARRIGEQIKARLLTGDSFSLQLGLPMFPIEGVQP
jgi:hypothetical protein